MSVLGSQLEIDLDPEGECVIFAGQRHVGNTGTGCYKLHDHRIKDTKKDPTIPADEKREATYMYAPTPDEPEPEPEEDNDQEPEGKEDHPENGGPGNGTGGVGQSTTLSGSNSVNSKSKSTTHMNNGSSVNQQQNNQTPHTPHLLDAPVQGAQSDRTNQLTPAVMQQQQQQQEPKPLNSPSQKSSSIGVSYYSLVKIKRKMTSHIILLPLYHYFPNHPITIVSIFCAKFLPVISANRSSQKV